MVILIYVDDCKMFIPSKDIVYEVYAFLQADLKIEDDKEIKKYLGTHLNRHLYGSIHLG